MSKDRRQVVFDIMELLERLPGVFADYILSQLDARHTAALALTCLCVRDAVQRSASTLTLRTGSCCLSRVHDLAARFCNAKKLVLKPGNLHEAMFVVPLLLIQAASEMTSLTCLALHDLLPDRPHHEVRCGSCSAWTSTYDLSAILAAAAACIPCLSDLEFSTHYISEAECAAIARMTGLTRLQLRSTHGMHVGGLSHLHTLERLVSCTLSDVHPRASVNTQDLAMLATSPNLTRLSLGLSSLTSPLLNCLADMHSTRWKAKPHAHLRPAQWRALRRTPSDATLDAPAAALRAALQLALHHSLEADYEFCTRPHAVLPAPPPLVSLRVVLRPKDDWAPLALGCLTALTHLYLGWCSWHQDDPPEGLDRSPPWPMFEQQQLGRLTRLQQLSIGWTPGPDLLAALAACTRLTHLQLGGLFSALHDPPPAGGLLLPSVRSLVAQLETPARLQRNPGVHPHIREPLMQPGCLAALAAFPGLTRVELAGRMFGRALATLPQVLPLDKLRELLLPHRLSATSKELAVLRAFTGLTHLRLGCRSVHHDGPATYTPAGNGGSTYPLSLSALTAPPTDTASLESTAAQDASFGAGKLKPAQQPECPTCGASDGCLCRLRCLEVVGPLPPSQLGLLRDLPALRHLILRANSSWSTGMSVRTLQQVIRTLDLVELVGVHVLDLEALEQTLLADSTRATPSGGVTDPPHAQTSTAAAPPRLRYAGAKLVVNNTRGITAAELGRGYPFMGVELTVCEEYGWLPSEVGGPYTRERLTPGPEGLNQGLFVGALEGGLQGAFGVFGAVGPLGDQEWGADHAGALGPHPQPPAPGDGLHHPLLPQLINAVQQHAQHAQAEAHGHGHAQLQAHAHGHAQALAQLQAQAQAQAHGPAQLLAQLQAQAQAQAHGHAIHAHAGGAGGPGQQQQAIAHMLHHQFNLLHGHGAGAGAGAGVGAGQQGPGQQQPPHIIVHPLNLQQEPGAAGAGAAAQAAGHQGGGAPAAGPHFEEGVFIDLVSSDDEGLAHEEPSDAGHDDPVESGDGQDD